MTIRIIRLLVKKTYFREFPQLSSVAAYKHAKRIFALSYKTRHFDRQLVGNVATSRISEEVGQGDLDESVTRGVTLLVYYRAAERPLHYSTAAHIYQADSRGWHQVRTIRKCTSARARARKRTHKGTTF